MNTLTRSLPTSVFLTIVLTAGCHSDPPSPRRAPEPQTEPEPTPPAPPEPAPTPTMPEVPAPEAAPFMGQHPAEQRMRAEMEVKQLIRAQAQALHRDPAVTVERAPVGGCTRGTSACRWIFAVEVGAGRAYFTVDPFDGTVLRGDPTADRWEPLSLH